MGNALTYGGFQGVMEQVERMLEDDYRYTKPIPIVQKRAVYDFALKVVLRDLIADVSMSGFFTPDAPYDDNYYHIPLLDKFENLQKEKQKICCNNLFVVSPMTDREKIKDAISDLTRTGFELKKGNYEGTLYQELGLLVIDNGFHHIQLADIQGTSSVNATIINLKDVFPRLRTDGKIWYIEGADIQADCLNTDWRLPVIYEIARRRWELLENYPYSGFTYIPYDKHQEDINILQQQRDFYKGQVNFLLSKICESCQDLQKTISFISQESE